MDDESQQNKAHKSRVTGNKAVRRDELRKKKAGIDLEPNRGKNPKAFQGPSISSHKSLQKIRSIERKETSLHVPTADKTLAHLTSEPPLLVAVVGPPGVGKTTLIRSMVKFYSGRNVRSLKGPVTVVAGRSRRVTFLECPNTLPAMCDIAKVADLILLMVDGNFGFEMETFEFLSIAQVHGFPKMFGVVSHLDLMKTSKALKKQKKFLRHRFWHEVAAGAKLLCLAPMHHGTYRSNDVLKLHRLLICVQPKIQQWRHTHSCVLVDRHEDVTNPDEVAADEKVSRTVALYGYIRGRPMKADQMVHVPGLGDFAVSHISRVDDPCPLHEPPHGAGSKAHGGHKMRHLSHKAKHIYAPYCDVGGVTYADDAIYVHEDAELQQIDRTGEGVELLRELQKVAPMDEAAKAAALHVVRRPVQFRDDDTMEPEGMADPVIPAHATDDDSEDDSSSDDDGIVAKSFGGVSKKHRSGFSLREFGAPEESADDDDVAFAGMPGVEKSGEADEEEEEDVVLAPRLPNDVDSSRVRKLRFQSIWNDNDSAATSLFARLKELCVTGSWNGMNPTHAAAGSAMKGGEVEGDEAGGHDKGYDSNDEEFERDIRATKTSRTDSRRRGQNRRGGASSDDDDDEKSGEDSDDNDDDRAENDDSDGDDGFAKHGAASNALASVASGGLYGARAAAAGSAGRRGAGAKPIAGLVPVDRRGSKFEHGQFASGDAGDNKAGDDYNILDDLNEDEGSPKKEGGSGPAFFDEELQGLVMHFSKAKSSLQETEGIDVFDPSDKTHRAYADAQEVHDEAVLDAAVQSGNTLSEEQEALLKKRMAKKKAFDESYDVDGGKTNTMAYYHTLQRDVQEKKEALDAAISGAGEDVDQKVRMVGYFNGLYVRIVLKEVPVEFLTNFDPRQPLVAGGLNAGEDQLHVVHAKIKRHRWYPKILKAQDPLVLSIGWRRIQTQPIFAQEDPNGRLRYLKYTPLHMHCYCAFYAPVCPTNTGFVAIPVPEARTKTFRCLATGYTIGNDTCTAIVKKLKLTGVPQKIQKTTAFVKGMFNSDIEAAKFVGAKLKTVSGIRGMFKSVIKGKQGLFRATFEDKILPSDIVFVRAWKPVDPPHFVATMRNLVEPGWCGMKTMGQLRHERGLPVPSKPDSEYREIKRRRDAAVDEPPTVLLSRNTRLNLPFAMKENFIPLEVRDEVQRRVEATTTVAPEPREMRRQAMLDLFETKADAMDKHRQEVKQQQRARAKRAAEREQEEYEKKLKKAKKETAKKAEFRSQHKSRK